MKELEIYHTKNHNGIQETVSHFKKKIYIVTGRLLHVQCRLLEGVIERGTAVR